MLSLLVFKARVNVPCTSKSSQQRRNKKALFTSSTDVQVIFKELFLLLISLLGSTFYFILFN